MRRLLVSAKRWLKRPVLLIVVQCTSGRDGRSKRQTESELGEARSAVNEMTTVNSRAGAQKRQVEGALHTMQAEIDDMLHQAKNSEEKAKKAMVDAARLADELRSE